MTNVEVFLEESFRPFDREVEGILEYMDTTASEILNEAVDKVTKTAYAFSDEAQLKLAPHIAKLGSYEGLEGYKHWAGPYELHAYDMTWHRPEHFYSRSARTGNIEQYKQLHRGPMVRPGPLRDVVHLDVPLGVLRSHPDTPNALPEDFEGIWTDTNPAWPELSIDYKLGKMGLAAAWADSVPAITEEYELVPQMVEDVNEENSVPFDIEPRLLDAVVVYVKPIVASETTKVA